MVTVPSVCTFVYNCEDGIVTNIEELSIMKKKGLAVLALSAVLSVGTLTMETYAAEGWALSNNVWVYLDSSGNRVKNMSII